MSNDYSQQSKIEAYRQHCEQVRADLGQRLSFTNFYAIVVAGILAFVSQRETGDFSLLFWALSVLSLFGIMFCVRLNCSIEDHNRKARLLMQDLVGASEDHEKYLLASSGWMKWRSLWYLRWLFVYLYVAGFVLFLLLAYKVVAIV
ncbi:MAG: hypothetical protein AABZ77_04495 [Chloroflexota bacterium]